MHFTGLSSETRSGSRSRAVWHFKLKQTENVQATWQDDCPEIAGHPVRKALLTREATSAAARELWQRDSPNLIFDLPGAGFLNEDR